MSDIYDFEIAMAYLEDAGWNLMNAVAIFTSQQQNPAGAADSRSNSSSSSVPNVPKSKPSKVSQNLKNLSKKSSFFKEKQLFVICFKRMKSRQIYIGSNALKKSRSCTPMK